MKFLITTTQLVTCKVEIEGETEKKAIKEFWKGGGYIINETVEEERIQSIVKIN